MDSPFNRHARRSRQILAGTVLTLSLWTVSYQTALGQTVPYKVLSDAGAGFFGHGRTSPNPDTLKAVCIGLTGPNNSTEGRHLQCGVALAVEEANERGGYRGIPYEVVFRPDDGPWGVAAKQVVHLTYDDNVWAILGALDGHHAHLAELVAAKAWIPVVTPSASDRTIDYANVPWVFRCFPDDGKQARALVGHAKRRGYKRIIALTEGDRESRVAWERLQDAAKSAKHPFSLQIEYDPYDPTSVIPRIEHEPADAFVVWGHPDGVIPIIRAIRKLGNDAPILGPALLATPEFAEKTRGLGDIVIAAPFDLNGNGDAALKTFYRRYADYSGMPPSLVALFAYDATRMVQAAIEKAGLNRARIRDELAGISFEGLALEIRFDELGGNLAKPVLVSLREGQWVCLD